MKIPKSIWVATNRSCSFSSLQFTGVFFKNTESYAESVLHWGFFLSPNFWSNSIWISNIHGEYPQWFHDHHHQKDNNWKSNPTWTHDDRRDIWWNDSNEFNKLYCRSSSHVGIPLSQTFRNPLRTRVSSLLPDIWTKNQRSNWELKMLVLLVVHQLSTVDIWHFCDFKETPRVCLVCWGEVQILGREQQKKKRKTRHEKRRTLMYSSTCFAASKPKLTACGVRSPGILGPGPGPMASIHQTMSVHHVPKMLLPIFFSRTWN